MAQRKADPKLLEILVCPITKGTLEYDSDAQELISHRAGLAFPIRDGIPIMLPDEARELDEGPVPTLVDKPVKTSVEKPEDKKP